MPRFGEYSPDTDIVGTELVLLRSEDGITRYTTTDALAEYAVGSPGGGTPPVVVEIVTETASFSVSQATHAAKHIRCSTATSMTVTFPANATSAIDVGCVFNFEGSSTGTVAFAAAGGVTLNSLGGALTLAGQFGVATAVKVATNVWLLTGPLV